MLKLLPSCLRSIRNRAGITNRSDFAIGLHIHYKVMQLLENDTINFDYHETSPLVIAARFL